MTSKIIFVPIKFGKPKKEDIYEVSRRIVNRNGEFVVKDIVWLRDGKWVSMSGEPIPDDQVKAWERKVEDVRKETKKRSNHNATI